MDREASGGVLIAQLGEFRCHRRVAAGELLHRHILGLVVGETQVAISVELDLLTTAPRLLSTVRDGVRGQITYELEGQLGIDIPMTPPVRYRKEGAIRLNSRGF